MKERYVHLTPRLIAALSMLKGAAVVADIGCDHGRLTAALLQQNICARVIATDISEPSLQKTKDLLGHVSLLDRVSFRAGDGLDPLSENECDAIAILGMGGTLMTRILSRCKMPLNGASCIVLQPMRAQTEIREYLYRNQYRITDDRIIREHDRLYQIFRAESDTSLQPWPDGFPKDFFEVGYLSFLHQDPELNALCESQICILNKQLKNACGSIGEEKLRLRIEAYEQIISHISRKQV